MGIRAVPTTSETDMLFCKTSPEETRRIEDEIKKRAAPPPPRLVGCSHRAERIGRSVIRRPELPHDLVGFPLSPLHHPLNVPKARSFRSRPRANVLLPLLRRCPLIQRVLQCGDRMQEGVSVR
jgi:hypothetical protein